MLDHMAALFLAFKGTSILFSTVAAQVYIPTNLWLGCPGGTSGKETSCQRSRRESSIPGLGISLGGAHGSPLQYPCLENPMDREAWWATVHRVAKSQTRPHDLACMHANLRLPKRKRMWEGQTRVLD